MYKLIFGVLFTTLLVGCDTQQYHINGAITACGSVSNIQYIAHIPGGTYVRCTNGKSANITNYIARN